MSARDIPAVGGANPDTESGQGLLFVVALWILLLLLFAQDSSELCGDSPDLC